MRFVTAATHASARAALQVVTNIGELRPGRGASLSLQRDFSPALLKNFQIGSLESVCGEFQFAGRDPSE